MESYSYEHFTEPHAQLCRILKYPMVKFKLTCRMEAASQWEVAVFISEVYFLLCSASILLQPPLKPHVNADISMQTKEA